MPHALPFEAFLSGAAPLLDVRSPSEYNHAHIPGAVNLPLFSDEERAAVGTAYKQQGHHSALTLALDAVGPKLSRLLEQGRTLLQGASAARLYCWRGGLRSGATAQLLRWDGVAADALPGGYKAFRRWALALLSTPPPLRVLGGLTGSGKTALLRRWGEQGEPVIDLEGLACHRGSAFGGDGTEQPSNEQFENLLALQLWRLRGHAHIWVEDESRFIGRCQLPGPFYEAMQRAPLTLCVSDAAQRRARLLADYGACDRQLLADAVRRLHKRLGGARCRQALSLLSEGRLAQLVDLLLPYYDRQYEKALARRAGPCAALLTV